MKFLSIILAVIVVAIGVFFFFTSKEAGTPSEELSPIAGEQTSDTGTEAVQNEPGDSSTPATTEAEVLVNVGTGSGAPKISAQVSHTDAGFEPKTTTIKKGETVRFVNNSSRGVWIASAQHPTHGVYPVKSQSDCLGSSFDSCQELKPSATWEFTFTEVGSWGYHDHLRASTWGTIVVE